MLIQEDYFKNIFNTVREAILILDENMRVLSANRSFFTIFKVDAANTLGSLLYDLGNGQWNIPHLRVLLEDVLPKNDTVDDYEIEHNFESIGHKTMLLNACKIREKKNDLPIILLAIEDISERRKIENGLEKTRKELETTKIAEDEASEFSESVINTVREPLISLDQDLRVVTVSRSFYEFFKVKPEETVGQLIYDLGNKQWDIPELRELLETILPQKTTFDNYEVEHDFATIGRRIMLLNARQIKRRLGKERIILLAIEDITERKRLEDLLTESEKRYRRVFETASDAIVLLEKDKGKIVHANPAAEKMLGYSEEEYVGKKLQDIGVSLDMSDFPAIIRSLNKSGILNYDDIPVKTRSGQYINTDIYLVDRAKLAQCNIRDVSERKQNEESLQRLNRTLLARSESSKAMMSARDEVWYLNEVCRIIVEDCGHALVWIGFAEQDEGRTVRPVAHAGFEDGYLESLTITWSDSESGRGPIGTAIRTGKPVFRIIVSDPAFAPWREEALKRGYEAVIGVPLLADGKAFGSLNIYSRNEDPFSDDEVQLLTDLAADLSYGIAAIRLRTAQTEAASALRESETRLRTLVQTIPDLVWLKDANGVYLTCNPTFERFFGAGEADILGKTDYDFVNRHLADVFREHDRKAMAAGKPSSQEDWITFADDGHRALMDTIKTPMYDARGNIVGVLGIGRDITKRKRADEALRESEMRYRSLFDNMLEGFAYCRLILEHDRARDFVYLAVNGAFESLTGLRDVVGKKVSEVIPGIQESNPELFEVYGRVAMTGMPERFETFSNAFGGWLSISVFSTEKEHFVAVFDNITERKRAEEKLRENELRLRTLLKTIPDLVWLKDGNGTFLACNPIFERLLGAGEADIIGKTDYDFVDRELADFFREHDRKAMAAGKPSRNEEWITFADDGHRALLDTIKTPMYDAGGNLIGVLGISRDITERKQAEAALAASEEQFRKLYQEFHGLLDAVPDSLMLLDKDLKVLWANRVAADSIGGTPETLVGRYCHSLWYERTTPCDPCPVMESFATGRPLSETVNRPDGRIFDIRTVPLRDEGGGIARVIEVVREVTEHSKLEAQYLQAQKMESIGTLAGGVAHDFNNILSAIIGYGHVTLMDMAGDSPHRTNIEHILEAADRAARLTKELLLFSRKHVSERKPMDLNEIVGTVEKFLRMVIGEDIECKTIRQDRSLPVYADGHQLEQVLMNLATNARDAMPGGGAFTIKTEQTELTEDFVSAHGYGKSGSYAMITVSDTGAGMDETTQKRIFEPFFTTKEVGKGTGLGLAVVYGIIKQHDGFINVYSEPGVGTTFRIYLPIIGKREREVTRLQRREAPARGTETVLVAEDDENLRKLSRTILAEFGYTVIEAADGEEAVKKFMENKDTIQLLLFDLIMPKMNGKEASDEIRKIKPDVKVLFASGYDPDLLQQKTLLEDGVHLVYKPISPMDLLRKVRIVLDGVTH